MSQVVIPIGQASLLRETFSFSPGVTPTMTSPSVLKDAIEHAVNQTLLRDMYFGAWACVSVPHFYKWSDDDEYSIRITSPDQDVSPFQKTLPAFLNAIAQGLQIYKSVEGKLQDRCDKLLHPPADPKSKFPPKVPTEGQLRHYFLPPFGLSMVQSDSIQLLHYPPLETLTYMDYLYSPTNRRWENLLGYNGFPGMLNTRVETIVDIAPIAADGGKPGGQLIQDVLADFQPYVLSMLQALLRPSPSGRTTQPIVAYGGPVGEWLYRVFEQDLVAQNVRFVEDFDWDTKVASKRPDVCQLFTLRFFGDKGPATPVFTANHPIKFNYYDSDYEKAEHPEKFHGKKVMTPSQVDAQSAMFLMQDLVAAGWQSEMAMNWQADPDPHEVLNHQCNLWYGSNKTPVDKFFDIFREQIREFSLYSMSEVEQQAWMDTLKAAVHANP